MSLDFGAISMWFVRQRRELAAAARARRAEELREQRLAEAHRQRRERQRRERHAARQRGPSHRMVLRSHLEQAVASAGVPGALPASTREALELMRGLCKCARCGVVGARDFFSRPKRCTNCAMAEYERDPRGWFAERLARDAATRAARVKVPCDIDAAWVRAAFEACDCLCRLCGNEMFTERRRHRAPPSAAGALFASFPLNASLDQRVAGAGYTKENAQLVHVRCNLAKLDMPQDDFIAMCKSVARYHDDANSSSAK